MPAIGQFTKDLRELSANFRDFLMVAKFLEKLTSPVTSQTGYDHARSWRTMRIFRRSAAASLHLRPQTSTWCSKEQTWESVLGHPLKVLASLFLQGPIGMDTLTGVNLGEVNI